MLKIDCTYNESTTIHLIPIHIDSLAVILQKEIGNLSVILQNHSNFDASRLLPLLAA